MILVVSLIARLSCDLDCKFRADSVYSHKQAVDCIRSVKLDVENLEQDRVINILDEIVQNDVFLDIIQSPQGSYETQTDVKEELSKLRDKKYETAEAFYSDVGTIFTDLKNPHSLFTKPCQANFTFALPFGIQATVDETTDPISIIITLTDLPTQYAKITDHYLTALKGKDYRNCVVTGVFPNEQGEYQDAYQGIREWANTHVYRSRIESSRFNAAIRSDFAIRRVATMQIPEEKILLKVKNTDTGVEENIELPFLSVVQGDFDKMDDICPIYVPPEESHPKTDPMSFSSISSARRRSTKDLELPRPQVTNTTTSNSKVAVILDSKYIKAYQTDVKVGDATEKAAILRIPDFNPEVEEMEWYLTNLTKSFELFKTNGITRLLVDLRANPGGYVALGLRTLQYMSPNLYPVMGQYDVRYSDLHTALDKQDELTLVNRHEYKSTKHVTEWYKAAVKRKFKNTKGVAFEYNYSKLYSIEICDDERQWEKAYRVLKKGAPITFDQQHLMFLTDGLCSSTCANVLKRADEAYLGRVYHLGGFPGEETTNVDIASAPGGSVLDSEWLFPLVQEYSKEKGFENKPVHFVRNGSLLRWTYEEIYSTNNKTSTIPQEFTLNEPDTVIHLYPNNNDFSLEGYETIMDHISPHLNQCQEWEVKISERCAPDTKNHLLKGHPCSPQGEFDEDNCVSAKCEKGYFNMYEGSDIFHCVPIPVHGEENAPWMLLLPLLIVVAGMVVSVVVSIVYCVVRNSKNLYRKMKTN
ncbi:hypothetical protein BLNAU_4268 [Blattamonas nauphoetae]|uniref:Tail specific protease domain-containing protein n=1 Tax=Blattamonas nauphoetae TaxID=2049346 RepID=A0ABQ9YAT3_9EUKA|nr:hypothetical protein BLNAU_4268 [Blattamonas nauphoetae]